MPKNRRESGGAEAEESSCGAVELALSLAGALDDAKGEEVRALDVRGLTDVMDFMVLATASSERHARALADAARGFLRDHGRRILGSEGGRDSGWVVVDAGDVVVHVFSRSLRRYYDLDGLWADAAEIDLGPEGAREGAV